MNKRQRNKQMKNVKKRTLEDMTLRELISLGANINVWFHLIENENEARETMEALHVKPKDYIENGGSHFAYGNFGSDVEVDVFVKDPRVNTTDDEEG